MKLKIIGPNQTEVRTNNGMVIFFSYETPCAAVNFRNHEDGGFPICKTNKKWSVTTSKHITKWAGSKDIPTRDQEFFDNLD